jgi:hypothetical protein
LRYEREFDRVFILCESCTPVVTIYLERANTMADDQTYLKMDQKSPLFYCPKCGKAEAVRERQPDGQSRCINGHWYPSREAVKAQQLKNFKPAAHYPAPTKEGHYWAKWRIAEEGSETWKQDTPPGLNWEAVFVRDQGDDDLVVDVPGEGRVQKLENFVWGPICTGKPNE